MTSDTFFVLPGPLTVYSRRAMAADFEVSVNEGDVNALAAFTALDDITRLEELLSVFLATSEVGRVNQLAAEIDIHVSDELIGYLSLCRDLWEKTDGAFDITCSPLWQAWGFSRHKGEVPDEETLTNAMKCVGMSHVRIDRETSRVAFDQAGVSINFGGIGKGIAIDRAATLLQEGRLGSFLIHGGKSSIFASGGRKGDRTPRRRIPCWTIGLGHPLKPNARLGRIHLVDQAIGTSGSQYQFFRFRGRRLSHIINPKTGQPAEGILAATVIAPSATVADALSTAFFILGYDKTVQYCEKNPDISVILLLETRISPGYELKTVNIDEDTVTFD